MTKNKPTTSLQSIIIRNFIGFAVVSAVLFSAVNFLIAYTIEDEYFDLHLQAEAEHMSAAEATHGSWPEPRFAYMRFYASSDDLPAEISQVLATEPDRVELQGTGERYFHIHRFNQNQGPFLISEVSDMLMVRSHTRFIVLSLSVIATLVTILAVYFAFKLAKRTARPMTQLADSVALLEPNKLPDDFPSNQAEHEVRQLAEAIKQLINRVTYFVSREQHFTRDVSHELRTPIAVIKSSVELLLQQTKTLDKQQLKTLLQIDFACVQMEQTVVTLLSLAREKTPQHVPAIKLLPVVEKVVLQQSKHIADKAVEVIIDVAADTQLLMHEAELVILLSNLIGNAFQYTHQGTVTIQFKNNVLSVTDTGKGIEDALQPHVKKPLMKGPDSQGFGIGLSLVDRLCEHQNITFEMSTHNKGTTVSLRDLPIK
ncbi:HAMP domain-containing sensor histidine kinase [Marinicella sp. S1101]|uniref:sensor histidine kinase n=1 Tax=Marinicella marina TaxID=2996016 RepID=UPI0022609368|nr:HAMP domain-containing sensor histidine kinase [Marinicella marina]MCX7554857.1 HAMP domain-containing sensor histidine kinase [Marinicella marina]MDJ1141515.1 HAMP domain-containing sensor histidine kinase [Marinicella marina]